MKSPRSTIRIFAPEPASSRAMVPPPAPLPIMMMSKECIGDRGSGVRDQGSVDLIHQFLILHGAFEAHLRGPAGEDRIAKILVHRLVAANVSKAGEHQARQPAFRASEQDGAI